MAQISVKKTIIKKRMATFKAHEEKGITKRKVLGWLAKPAAFITKTAKDPRTHELLRKIGEGSKRFAEAQSKRAAPKRHKKTTRKHRKSRK